jgi:hypothetical protein
LVWCGVVWCGVVWCGGGGGVGSCGACVGKGLGRKAARGGPALSPTLLSRPVVAHVARCQMVICTNPKASDYDFVSGCRKKDEDFTAADNETHELATAETKTRLVTDPFFKLEHVEADKRKAKTTAGVMFGGCAAACSPLPPSLLLSLPPTHTYALHPLANHPLLFA